MKEIAEKLKDVEKSMAKEKGPFDLFALFLREDAPGKWDLVVASEWINKNKERALKYIADNVQGTLNQREFLTLSRISIIDETNPALEAFHRAVSVEHGMTEIKDSSFFGLQIKHAYLITSQKRGDNARNKAV